MVELAAEEDPAGRAAEEAPAARGPSQMEQVDASARLMKVQLGQAPDAGKEQGCAVWCGSFRSDAVAGNTTAGVDDAEAGE